MTDPQTKPVRKTIRILIADDDENVRSALRLLLSQEAYVRVVGDTPSADDMLAISVLSRPDVVLLDVDLPGLRPDLLDIVRSRWVGVRIIGMSSRRDGNTAISAKLDGLIDKMYGPADLRAALRGPRATQRA